MSKTVNDVFVDPLLTNVSIAYKNAKYIADLLFPVVEVDKKTGYYYVYDKSNLKKVNSQRAQFARANRVDFGLTKTAYGPLIERCLEGWVDYDILAQYDSPLDPRSDETENVTEIMQVNKETDLATSLASTAVVTQNTTLSGTDQWSDFTNSDPFDDITVAIDTVKKACLQTPNTFVVGAEVWTKLRNHPDLLDRLPVINAKTLTPENMKLLFPEFSNVIIADAVYNTADEGAADSLSFIWGKNAWVMYVEPNPRIKSISAGYTLTLKGARSVDRWDEPANKREVVRVNDYFEQKLVATAAIYLIKNAVA